MKPIVDLLEQTDKLVAKAGWFAPVATDGGNIEGNYRQLSQRIRAVYRWTQQTSNGKGAAEVLRLLNGGKVN